MLAMMDEIDEIDEVAATEEENRRKGGGEGEEVLSGIWKSLYCSQAVLNIC
tara:strand:- start:1611 stop:1763 length:153 start_codon:yes stop_codon:yes gene_type:complete